MVILSRHIFYRFSAGASKRDYLDLLYKQPKNYFEVEMHTTNLKSILNTGKFASEILLSIH